MKISLKYVLLVGGDQSYIKPEQPVETGSHKQKPN